MSTDAIAKYGDLLFAVLQRRWSGAPEDAQDASQVVAEKLIHSAEVPNESYVASMFRNAAIDRLRAEATRRSYEGEFASHSALIDETSPERQLAASRALQALQSAVTQLSPLDQEIFLRAYLHGQLRADIADDLRLSVSTVEKRLAKSKQRCLERVREHLDLQ